MTDQTLPKISVVTVVYNDAAHLEHTMLSVLNQTYPNIEYIIIDGNSTDGTVDVIKKYADKLGYWVSEKDAGMFDAMNKGVSHATGDWVQILNSGDYLISPTIFADIFSKPLPSADILYGNFQSQFSERAVLCSAPDDVVSRAYQGMQVCHSTMFVRTTVAKKFPYDTTYRHSADGEFFARAVHEGCRFYHTHHTVFAVGTFGNSFNNWLPCRIENWKINRHYFPGFRTDWYHGYALVREVSFRVFKWLFSTIGLYQLARAVYRKKIRAKHPMLPPNVKPLS